MEPHNEVPDDVSARLAALDDQPVEEHVAVYDALHRELRDQLVDVAPEGQAAPRPHP
jgi:hypothetical protein